MSGLGDQQPVERIAMQQRQMSNLERMGWTSRAAR
jgi:hypothetical protein